MQVLNLAGCLQVAGILLLLICSVSIWATGHARGIFASQAEDDDTLPRMQASCCLDALSASPAEALCSMSDLAGNPECQDMNGNRFVASDFWPALATAVFTLGIFLYNVHVMTSTITYSDFQPWSLPGLLARANRQQLRTMRNTSLDACCKHTWYSFTLLHHRQSPSGRETLSQHWPPVLAQDLTGLLHPSQVPHLTHA